MRNLLALLLMAVGFSCFGQIAPEYVYTADTVNPVSLRATGAFYYRFDPTAKKVLLFNGSHQLFKTVNLPVAGTTRVQHVSATVLNADTLVEVLYDEYTGASNGFSTYTTKVVNDTGAVLFTAPQTAGGSGVDERPGLNPALIIREIYGSELFSVYRLPGFTKAGPFYFHTSRVNLDGVGEKILTYTLIGTGMLHNTDGTVWKTLPTYAVSYACYMQGSTSFGNSEPLVSRQRIDADTGLEIIAQGTCNGVGEGRITRENGSVVLTLPTPSLGQTGITFSALPNQPDKLLVNDTQTARVYSLPGMILEHTYTDSMVLNRILLDQSGPKYWRYNYLQRKVELYNPDHTFWKAVPLAHQSGEQLGGIYALSEKELNNDAYVDVLYTTYNPTAGAQGASLKLANETSGFVTIDASLPGYVRFYKFPDGTCKVLVREDAPGAQRTTIYGFPIAAPASVHTPQTLAVTVGPNPTTSDVFLKFSAPSAAPRVVACYNLQGVLVRKVQTAAGRCSLSLAGQPSGLYQLVVTEGNRRFTEKVFLQ